MEIQKGMNSNRTNYDDYSISYLMITKYWLLGFVEGDGSFHLLNNNRAIFSITQKDRKVLDQISLFIQNWISNSAACFTAAALYKETFVCNKGNCIISGKNNNTAYVLSISDTDVLFQYIFPFFNKINFLSRKGVDFKI